MQRLGGLEHLQSRAATHLEVAHHHVEEALVQLLDGGIAIRRLFDVVRGLPERLRETASQGVVIVSDKDPSHVCSSFVDLRACVGLASRYR